MKKLILSACGIFILFYILGCGNSDTNTETNYPSVDTEVKTLSVPLLKENDLN